ncbi:MAG: IS1634 family transposase [Candidatus Brocadia sp.]
MGNKVKQRIVRHVGTALNEEDISRLKALAEYIKTRMEREGQLSLFSDQSMARRVIEARHKTSEEPLLVNLKELREESRITLGIHEVYGQLYRESGFDRVIPNASRKVGAVKNLFHIVMGRLANPGSKMATVGDLSVHFGVNLSLSGVYRMMDAIDDKVIEHIHQAAYSSSTGLLKEAVKVVFYDCTTLYFESFTEDDLKQCGYSKDMKFNQSQVILAILVTQWGLPIGYQVYEGSCYEGHTLKDAIEKIEEQYQIKEITFVADSAMLSKANVELLEKMGKQYIVGARIRSMPKAVKKEILDKDSYRIVKHEKDSTLQMKEIDYQGKRLIITYSSVRAQKDAHDRQKAIERLLSRLNKNTTHPEKLISNYGYKKYIKVSGDAKVEIDQQRVEEDARWDGLHGIMTNDKELSAEQIIEQYHGLWQIEETFRIAKHDLKIRPIFHWTPRRVRAHIAICFMALCLSRQLQYRLRVLGKSFSPQVIRQSLMGVQLSIVCDQKSGQRYGIPSSITQQAKEIYQSVGLKLSDIPFPIK